jgi:uncharacterized protein (TIGR02284 family)
VDQQLRNELEKLHTAAIDARNGYQEAAKDADGKGMTPLFLELITLHQDHAAALSQVLVGAGAMPDDSGSLMSTVHKTIMDVRSLFNGLDESVLPGLIDGETRNVAKYDEAIQLGRSSEVGALLAAQRGAIQQKIAEMQSIKAASQQSAA